MQKNNEFIGVDEKFVPEEEQKANNDVFDEIKGDLKTGYENLKKPENKEKIKKGATIFAKIGIGYVIVVVGLVILIFIITFVMLFKGMSTTNKIIDKSIGTINDIVEQGTKDSENVGESIIDEEKIDQGFLTTKLEFNSGEQTGMIAKEVLDMIINNNKKYPAYAIAVIYDGVNTTNASEITSMKQKLQENSKYEISLDYIDKNVSKVTIENIN